MAVLMSIACTAQSYIDTTVPKENAIGFGPSLLVLSDDVIDKGPYAGIQFNMDAIMGRHFVVGTRLDAFQKTVSIKHDTRPAFNQQRRLYSVGAQVSLDPGVTGKGLYAGGNMSYLWTDFRTEDTETGEFSVPDDFGASNHVLTGFHFGANGNFGERIGLGFQTDFDLAIGTSGAPRAMSKAHIGIKYKF